jgi:hypothetical protein
MIRHKIRNVALGTALAAVAATAWAMNSEYNSTLVPAYTTTTVTTVEAAPSAPPVVVEETLAPGETVVTQTVIAPAPAPVVVRTEETRIAQPGITVEQRRLSEDERIQLVVMDKLASNPRLSGKLGVEARDSVVTLSGWTRTAGQAWHAERDARSVYGVKYVQNEIRPRIGGSV